MELSIAGILLGLLNIAVVVVILLLVGIVVWWVFTSLLSLALPVEMRKLYIALVALIALYMLIALLLGMPTWHPLGSMSIG